MALAVICKSCQARFLLNDDLLRRRIAGKVVTVRCRQCHAHIEVDATAIAPGYKAPRVFVSYAWEDGEDGVYRRWVGSLCARLRSDGIDARLDRWHNENGNVVSFMTAGLRDADKVLILCSPAYQAKVHATESAEIMTGSGWEATLVAASMFGRDSKTKAAKLVLALVLGEWEDAAPDFLLSRNYVDLRHDFEDGYKTLLRRLLGISELVPAVGTPPADLTVPPLTPARGPFHHANRARTQTRAQYLSDELNRAIERKARLAQLGDSTGAVDDEVITLKRQLREGGRIPEGDCLGDRYVLRSKLGEGGYATVWRAHDKHSDADVALKVLHSNLAGSGASLERFRRGARIMATLDHPNIVRVVAHDCEDLGWHYFVMECLGSDLGKQPPTSPTDAVDKILRVADALIITHGKGHVHRDVKPANILLSADGTPKLADFDLVMANDTTGGTRSGALGTFIYAAPESLTHPENADARADVYGLAMSLLFCLYGKELPISVVRSLAPALDQIGAAPSLRRVFERALSWDLEERYPSMAAFRDALLAHKQGISTPASDIEASSSPEPSATRSTASLSLVPQRDVEPVRARTTGAFVLGETAPPRGSAPAGRKQKVVTGVILAAGVGVTLGGYISMRSESRAANRAPAASVSARLAPPVALTCPPGMSKIPAGQFAQGSEAEDAPPNQKPIHSVTLSAFCMDTYEVTAAEYRACSDDGKCPRLYGEVEYKGLTLKDKLAYSPLCTTKDPTKAQHPVNCIPWQHAHRFCEMHDKRLPTEAEWEYATRGPDARVYPWGDEAPTADRLNACGTECLEWAKQNKVTEQFPRALYDADDGFATTSPVGKFRAGCSRFGPCDVVGNVWEWVADWQGDYLPSDQENPTGPERGTERVIRGGAWNGSYPEWLHPQFRFSIDPATQSWAVGFRCAKDLAPSQKPAFYRPVSNKPEHQDSDVGF